MIRHASILGDGHHGPQSNREDDVIFKSHYKRSHYGMD